MKEMVDSGSPYRGLAAFEDTAIDALFFFGRERDTETIAANLLASRFTILYGPLGVGKSSVLRAGVARRLRSIAGETVVVCDSWAGDPAGGLVAAVAGALGLERPSGEVALADGLTEMTSTLPGGLCVILDQFEELFAYGGGEDFATALAEVVRAPHLRVNVLLSLREDALAELDVFTGRVPNVFGNHLPLDPLDREAARRAILGPLARYNELSGRSVEIEPELVEAVLDEVQTGRVRLEGTPLGEPSKAGSDSIEAPFLQLVMQRLWEAERSVGPDVLRLATFESLGRAETIVRAHLDEAMAELSDGQQEVAARVFNHLVTPSGTKIAHGVRDLAGYADVAADDLEPVLTSLAADRILRPMDGRWEIFHDVLADSVLAWRARHEADRTLERERAAAQRRHRRLLGLLAASLLALAAMAAVTVYALTQRSQAREQAGVAHAEARTAAANALSAQAGVLIPVLPAETDPQLGLLLAAEAARGSPTHRAADTLRRALLVSLLRAVLPDAHVTIAAFSPDGERIVVGTARGNLRVYLADASTRVLSLRAGGPVLAASFSPDGAMVLSAARNSPARAWEARTGDRVASYGHAPTAASFSPDGSRVLTVDGGEARVWSVDGSSTTTLEQRQPVLLASFAPNGRLVVTSGDGDTAHVFDAQTGRRVARVDQGSSVTSAAITPDGQHLVTTGKDHTARFWSLADGGRLLHILRGHAGEVTGTTVSPGGRLLVTTSRDTTARIWKLPSGKLVSDLVGHNNRVTGAAFSTDGRSFVTWSVDGTARVWDRRGGSARAVLAGHGSPVTNAGFDPSGQTVLTTAGGNARLWASDVDAKLVFVSRIPAPIAGADFSADGSVAAVAGRKGVVVLKPDGTRVAMLPAGSIGALAVDGQGSLVAASEGTRISVWRLPRRRAFDTVEESEPPSALALDGRATRLAVGTRTGTVRLWSPRETDSVELGGPGPRVNSLAFSPTGDRLVAGFANGALETWSVPDGQVLYRRVVHRSNTAPMPSVAGVTGVTSVQFSRSGERIVTAGADTTARVLDAGTGRVLYSLRGHSSGLEDAAFSPSGLWVVTASRLAGLWDRATGQRLLFLHSGRAPLLAASFDPSGNWISAVSTDGTLRRYACGVCRAVPGLLQLVQARIASTGRELTAAERQRYLGTAP
jgi:WD40 repeat protein